jgi:pimeloyl-ACP methyl ester carboxylesterase
MVRLTYPLVKFLITKKDTDLRKFTKAFVPEEDDFMFRLQKTLLLGLNMDYRRPTLLKEKDVCNFTNPVYMIVADDDVFFPGSEAIDRAKALFKNFKEAYILNNCKHMPRKEHYSEIQQKIKYWIEE